MGVGREASVGEQSSSAFFWSVWEKVDKLANIRFGQEKITTATTTTYYNLDTL